MSFGSAIRVNSAIGPFATCRRVRKTSAYRGRPEVIDARSERRDRPISDLPQPQRLRKRRNFYGTPSQLLLAHFALAKLARRRAPVPRQGRPASEGRTVCLKLESKTRHHRRSGHPLRSELPCAESHSPHS